MAGPSSHATVLLRALPVVVAGLLGSGCGNSATAPSQAAAVDALLSEVGSAQTAVSTAIIAGGGILPPTTVAPSSTRCPFDSASQHFVCASTTVAGVTITGWLQLLDASGRPETTFDAATTAAIHTVTDMSGTVSTGVATGAVTMSRHADETLTGLLTGAHTLNGTGSSTSSFAIDGTTTTYTDSETIDNLVLPAGSSSHPWPQSGTIRTTLALGGNGQFQTAMTFNGTSTVTMTTTSGLVTRTCTIDLANPTILGSCH